LQRAARALWAAPMRAVWVLAALAVLCGCRSDEPKRKARPARYDGPVIDFHAHADDVDAFLKNALNPRVTRVVAIVTAPAGNLAATRDQNNRVMALREQSAKVIPVPSVHPHDGAGALEEVNRMAEAGARMIALHLERQRAELTDGSTLDVVRRAGERGMVVILETAAGEPGLFKKVVELASKAPNTRIVLAQMGLSQFGDAALLQQTRVDNLYFDLSATATLYKGSPYVEELLWVIRLFPDRVFFGSDFPRWSSADATDATERLGLSAGEMSMIFYANAAKLLGL
jgi:predicted TIM-barrel fold metal-dependent hydrolase